MCNAAYAPNQTFNKTSIQTIVEYARLRGIRVIPEFDVPGHTASWIVAFPSIIAGCWEWAQQNNELGLFWNMLALDPTQNLTYHVLEQVIKEASSIFSDPFLHMGGDEVFTTCWEVVPSIATWMQQNGYANFSNGNWVYNSTGLWGDFEHTVQNLVNKYNKTAILWEESFDHSFPLNPSTVINIWLSSEKLQEVVQSGRRAIVNYGYYLDRQLPTCGGSGCPSDQYHWMFVDTWQDFYRADPLAGINLTDTQLALVLGGEASSWGENCDSQNIDDRIWTRGPAIAERLWSAASWNDTDLAAPRIASFRCKLIRRGIAAGPIDVDYCSINPSAQQETPSSLEEDATWKYVAIPFIVLTSLLLVIVIILLFKLRSAGRVYESVR